jgi:hypothetical protein
MNTEVEIGAETASDAAAQIRLSLAVTPMSEKSRKALTALLSALDEADRIVIRPEV